MAGTAFRERRFEDLVADVRPDLDRYLRRRAGPATAEDVLGDVLVVLRRRADEIPEEGVLPWCYRIARGCVSPTTDGGRVVAWRSSLVSGGSGCRSPPATRTLRSRTRWRKCRRPTARS